MLLVHHYTTYFMITIKTLKFLNFFVDFNIPYTKRQFTSGVLLSLLLNCFPHFVTLFKANKLNSIEAKKKIQNELE